MSAAEGLLTGIPGWGSFGFIIVECFSLYIENKKVVTV